MKKIRNQPNEKNKKSTPIVKKVVEFNMYQMLQGIELIPCMVDHLSANRNVEAKALDFCMPDIKKNYLAILQPSISTSIQRTSNL
jgi:hypothetical protein